MLFHVGALYRLNEIGLLPKIARIASVSGGSIAAGALGARWGELDFDQSGVATNFGEAVAIPLYGLAGKFIDLPAGILRLIPGVWSANVAARLYDLFLFNGRTLQHLPQYPQFVFNATSLQTGVLWRFAKDYAAEYRVGEWASPNLKIALAVGASAAFPPYLSPLRIFPPPGAIKALPGPDLSREPYVSRTRPYGRRRLRQFSAEASLQTVSNHSRQRRRWVDAPEAPSQNEIALAVRPGDVSLAPTGH